MSKKAKEQQITFAFEKPRPERHKIRDLPAEDQPVNRLLQYGPGSLSTTEILAVITQIPEALSIGDELITKQGGLLGLARASTIELSETDGIGKANAARIKAAFELGRRLIVASPQDRPKITSPGDAANLLMADMSLLEQEHLRVLLLDTKNNVLASPTVYKGSVHTSVVRIGELFRDAIKSNAVAIILAHNHPSGDPTPSREDVRLTEQVVEAGKLLDIEVLDHLVIGQQRYVSLKERGLGFGA